MAGSSYCSPADATSWGLTAQQSDCDAATAIVDGYVGALWPQWFSQAISATVTVPDVRRPLVPLPRPFANITAVVVDTAHSIDLNQIIVEAWGIRLYQPTYFDPDGFPRRIMSAVGYDWRLSNRSPFGSQVAVTATFGIAACPPEIKHATLLVLQRLLAHPNSIPVDDHMQAVAVEGYMIRWDPATPPKMSTTGVIDADRILQRYRVRQMVW